MRVLELELASGVTLIVDAQPDKATKNDARLSFHLKVVSPPVDKREGVEQWSTITAQEAMVLIAGVARSPEGLGWMAPWPAPEPGDDE